MEVQITGKNKPVPFNDVRYNTEGEVEEYLFKLYWDDKKNNNGNEASMTHRWGKEKPKARYTGDSSNKNNYVNTYDYSMSRLIIVEKVPDDAIPDVLVWLS